MSWSCATGWQTEHLWVPSESTQLVTYDIKTSKTTIMTFNRDLVFVVAGGNHVKTVKEEGGGAISAYFMKEGTKLGLIRRAVAG